MDVIESPFISIIADLAKNNKNLTPALQDAIAQFLMYQASPKIFVRKPPLSSEPLISHFDALSFDSKPK